MPEKNIPKIMIVTGDDSFALDMSWDKYLARVREARGECLVDTFDSAAEKIGDFLTRAMTAPLFQEVRVFRVLHAQALSEKELAAVDKALGLNLPDVYIFVSAEVDNSVGKKAAGAGKVAKALQIKKRAEDSGVEVYDYSKPPDYKMAGWIAEQVPLLFKRRISAPDAEYLAGMVDYDFIYSELRKIDQALEPGAPVDKKIIDKIVGKTKTRTRYELADALAQRDLPEALAILDSLFSERFETPSVVSAVFKRFWEMLKIKKFLDKNPNVLRKFYTKGYGKDSPQSQAAFEIGVGAGLLAEKDRATNKAYPVIIKSGIVQNSRRFSEKALRDVLNMLQRFDVDSKGKIEPTPLNVQMLCYRIVRAA